MMGGGWEERGEGQSCPMGGGWEERGEGQSCPVSSLNLEKVIFMALGVGFGHVR